MFGKAKVYLVNKENEEVIKNYDDVVYSDDKKYALVNSKGDIDSIYDLYKFSSWDEYQRTKSLVDHVYDRFIEEFGVEVNKYKNWALILKVVDQKIEEVVSFGIQMGNINCLINKKDSVSIGSLVRYLIAKSGEKDNIKVVTASINFKCKKGDE